MTGFVEVPVEREAAFLDAFMNVSFLCTVEGDSEDMKDSGWMMPWSRNTASRSGAKTSTQTAHPWTCRPTSSLSLSSVGPLVRLPREAIDSGTQGTWARRREAPWWERHMQPQLP